MSGNQVGRRMAEKANIICPPPSGVDIIKCTQQRVGGGGRTHTRGCLFFNMSYLETVSFFSVIFIYLFWVLHCLQQCTGHIMTGHFMGKGNQYIQLVKVLYCKLLSIGKQLPTFPNNIQGLTTDLRGGRPVSYHCATMATFFSYNDKVEKRKFFLAMYDLGK